MERIQKILSQHGVASRRQAEQMILAGRVTCNGQLCSLGQTADPEVDEIMVDGKPLPSAGSCTAHPRVSYDLLQWYQPAVPG